MLVSVAAQLATAAAPPASPASPAPAANEPAQSIVLAFEGLVFTVIILGALLGNALVIASVRRHRKLRVLTNYYVVSLALADMLVALCAMTFNASYELTGRWMFGGFMCDVWNSLDVYFSTASILHLCCISVDRYLAIVRPLEYPVAVTHRTVCCALANVWFWPAIISFTPIFMGWYTTDEHRAFRAANPDVCAFVVNEYYVVVSSSVSFWIPGIVMVTMYCRIYREAVRQREALARTGSNILLNSVHMHRAATRHGAYLAAADAAGGSGCGGDVSPAYSACEERLEDVGRITVDTDTTADTVTDTPADTTADTGVNMERTVRAGSDAASSGYCSGGSHRRSSGAAPIPTLPIPPPQSYGRNVALARAATELNSGGANLRTAGKSWKAEHKAARTLGVIMGAFLLCWLPFFLWYVITTLCGAACPCPDSVVTTLFWVGYLNSALNPLIYAYFNRDFREAFRETLRKALPCSDSCTRLRKPQTETDFV